MMPLYDDGFDLYAHLDEEEIATRTAPAQTWMACERPGCCHDIATDHEDGAGRCVRAGCACEAALVRVSAAITGKVSR